MLDYNETSVLITDICVLPINIDQKFINDCKVLWIEIKNIFITIWNDIKKCILDIIHDNKIHQFFKDIYEKRYIHIGLNIDKLRKKSLFIERRKYKLLYFIRI